MIKRTQQEWRNLLYRISINTLNNHEKGLQSSNSIQNQELFIESDDQELFFIGSNGTVSPHATCSLQNTAANMLNTRTVGIKEKETEEGGAGGRAYSKRGRRGRSLGDDIDSINNSRDVP